MKRIRFNEKSNIGFFDGAKGRKKEEEEEEEEEVEEEGKKIIFPSFPKIFDGYSKNLTLSYYTVLNYTPQLHPILSPIYYSRINVTVLKTLRDTLDLGKIIHQTVRSLVPNFIVYITSPYFQSSIQLTNMQTELTHHTPSTSSPNELNSRNS